MKGRIVIRFPGFTIEFGAEARELEGLYRVNEAHLPVWLKVAGAILQGHLETPNIKKKKKGEENEADGHQACKQGVTGDRYPKCLINTCNSDAAPAGLFCHDHYNGLPDWCKSVLWWASSRSQAEANDGLWSVCVEAVKCRVEIMEGSLTQQEANERMFELAGTYGLSTVKRVAKVASDFARSQENE